MVDIAPLDEREQPAEAVRTIAAELAKFSPELADMPRWLVINKVDLLPEDERDDRRQSLCEALEWQGPVFEISAATGEGTDALGQAVMRELEEPEEDFT